MRLRVALLVVAVVMAAAPAAFAHYISTGWDETATFGGGYCVKGMAQMSHSSTVKAQFSGGVEVWGPIALPSGMDCAQDSARKERVAVRTWMYKWYDTNPPGYYWVICRNPGYVNGPYGFRFTIYYNWNAPPCGAGWYGADSIGQAQNGTTWYGGWVATWTNFDCGPAGCGEKYHWYS